MSSPIVNQSENVFKRKLVAVHQQLSHNNRISLLTDRIGAEIQKMYPDREIRCLDVGCGDMTLAENIERANPRTRWDCIDIHALPPHLQDTPKWRKYRQFDGQHMPFGDKHFDAVLFCDVLHHAGPHTPGLLREAARVGKTVIIKDHFEYGVYSRSMLKLMDIVGNWGYGIVIPRRYFSVPQFRTLCTDCNLREVHMARNIALYDHIPVLRHLLRPEWQFIAVLTSE